jgi:hypothetical protein
VAARGVPKRAQQRQEIGAQRLQEMTRQKKATGRHVLGDGLGVRQPGDELGRPIPRKETPVAMVMEGRGVAARRGRVGSVETRMRQRAAGGAGKHGRDLWQL